MQPFLLASASPRRQDILRQLGLPFETFPTGASEAHPDNLPPEEIVRILAMRKAEWAVERFPKRSVIAADTMVLLDDQLLGKPHDPEDAKRMLRCLSGRSHRVLTGVCIAHEGQFYADTATTDVAFRPLSDADIRAYVDAGLSDGKAGAYGIQDRGALFVREIRGDYYNVVGLPVFLLTELLGKAGFPLAQLISKGD